MFILPSVYLLLCVCFAYYICRMDNMQNAVQGTSEKSAFYAPPVPQHYSTSPAVAYPMHGSPAREESPEDAPLRDTATPTMDELPEVENGNGVNPWNLILLHDADDSMSAEKPFVPLAEAHPPRVSIHPHQPMHQDGYQSHSQHWNMHAPSRPSQHTGEPHVGYYPVDSQPPVNTSIQGMSRMSGPMHQGGYPQSQYQQHWDMQAPSRSSQHTGEPHVGYYPVVSHPPVNTSIQGMSGMSGPMHQGGYPQSQYQQHWDMQAPSRSSRHRSSRFQDGEGMRRGHPYWRGPESQGMSRMRMRNQQQVRETRNQYFN